MSGVSGVSLLDNLRRMRIRYLIMIVVGIAVTVGLVATAYLYANKQETALHQQNERSMLKLTESIQQGLQMVMLAGHAEVAETFADNLKHVPQVSDIRILRINGQEAFRDNQTIDEVNTRRGSEDFAPRDEESKVEVLSASDPNLKQVIETVAPVSVYSTGAGGSKTLTFLAPLKNIDVCYKCHGRAKPVRGVLLLSTSLAHVDRDILRTWQQTVVLLIVALTIAMLSTGYLMGRTVVNPIERVNRALIRVAEGDLQHRLEVTSQDELGAMAHSFNQMTSELDATYGGLQKEQDKLSTIILGAGEGIIVTDPAGQIALVNPAAETLLGKTPEQIKAAGLLDLLGDADAMTRWLSGETGGEAPVIEYNGHILQVFASTIHADDGHVTGSAVLLRDITEEKRLEDQLRRLSYTDALTSLYNRRFLDETLQTEYIRTQRNPASPLSVIMFDVDHFKKFNDTHGHDQGDRVLQAVAREMRETLRLHDFACRYGGEEFIAILPHTTLEGAAVVAERLRLAIEAMVVDGLKVTISLGVSCFPELAAESPKGLVDLADAALYRSKEGGRNRVSVSTGPEESEAT